MVAVDEVEVRRSSRRRKSVQAYRRDGRTIVLVPDTLSAAEEADVVRRLVAKLDRAERRRAGGGGDLESRAAELSRRYLGGRAVPSSIRWVSNQNRRWGSCSLGSGHIRLSDRMMGMPDWVIDAVIVHELAHLLVPDHGPEFKRLIAAYPHGERARGFLEGFEHARAGRGPATAS